MATRTLLTWNLNGRDPPLASIVKYVERLVREGHEYVVALQESVEDADQVRVKTGGYAYGNGGLVLLSSQPLAECELHNRFVMGVVSFAGSTFVVFNYHGRSRTEKHLPPEARGGYASEYRWVFNHLAKGRRTIIMGDFNAKPDDEEVSHRACFSFHGRGDPAPRTLVSHHNSSRDDLRVMPPAGDEPTYVYKTGEHADRKLVYDYFVVSAPLVPKLVVEVVKTLDGVPLGDIDGYPTKSDHYPVRACWTD